MPREFKRHLESARLPVVGAGVQPYAFERTWACTCGAQLTIKSKTNRDDGPSNFVVDIDPRSRSFGHSLVPSGRLNWEGLREERGWERRGDAVSCLACVNGRSVEEQRRLSRFDPIRVGVEIAARHITRQSGGTIQAEAVFTAFKVPTTT